MYVNSLKIIVCIYNLILELNHHYSNLNEFISFCIILMITNVCVYFLNSKLHIL